MAGIGGGRYGVNGMVITVERGFWIALPLSQKGQGGTSI